jgi:hypothetical protein
MADMAASESVRAELTSACTSEVDIFAMRASWRRDGCGNVFGGDRRGSRSQAARGPVRAAASAPDSLYTPEATKAVPRRRVTQSARIRRVLIFAVFRHHSLVFQRAIQPGAGTHTEQDQPSPALSDEA